MSSTWSLVYKSFNPKKQKLREALCVLGNGYFATRGALCEADASDIHYPGTYLAGVYNELSTKIAGRTIINESMVNCPNWIKLEFKIGTGDWINLLNTKTLKFNQTLNFKEGFLNWELRLKDKYNQITDINIKRIVHMKYPHLGAISYEIIPQNYEQVITVNSTLDGSVENTGVERYRQLNSKHLLPFKFGKFEKNGMYLAMITKNSKIVIAEAARTQLYINGQPARAKSSYSVLQPEKVSRQFSFLAKPKQSYLIEKIVSIYTSRDKEKDLVVSAINSVKQTKRFSELFKSHQETWKDLWKKCDIQIVGDNFSQKVIRLHIFHLLQTASIHNKNIDAGLPARGLHGESYRGLIFWDEIFALPFYDFNLPEVAKALLLYRYRRLDAARKYARENGYRGAMFPWNSGSTGEERTQPWHLNPISGRWGPDYSRYQRHVSFAIAYNVWQHWNRTADLDFLVNYGAEMLLSIARFAASLVYYDSKDKRYHTRKVMGPDEFHEKYPDSKTPGLKDNAYTNLMIAWTLIKAEKVLEILPPSARKRILDKLNLTESELKKWDEISRKMKLIINKDGIISQFDGYFKLKELNLARYRRKYGNIQRMDRILKAEGKSPDEYKIIKQADALMIFYLLPLDEIIELFKRLGYYFNLKLLRKNYNYYLKRTSHGSTLSPIVHGFISIILNQPKQSWDWFQKVLSSDICDIQQGTTQEGIHIGTMGGSIDLVIRGFAGVKLLEDKVRINPRLPQKWQKLKFDFSYQGKRINLSLTRKKISLFLSQSETSPVLIEINKKVYSLLPKRKLTLTI